MDLIALIDALGPAPAHGTAAEAIKGLLGASGSESQGGAAFMQATPDQFGGMNFVHNGVHVGAMRPSPLGGSDILDAHGMPAGHIGASPLGGLDIHGAHGMPVGHIGASPLGGLDIHGAHGLQVGHIGASPLGGLDIHGPHGLAHHMRPDDHGGWTSDD